MIINQDLHLHTNLSSCAKRETTLESYLEPLRKQGIKTAGIANHLWDSAVPGSTSWYAPQNFGHICGIKSEMDALKDCGIRFLFGAEVEYCYAQHRMAISEEAASQLDYVIVPNSHTHITMPKEFYPDYQRHADFMVQALRDILNDPNSKYVTAIAHPFFAVCCPYDVELPLKMISDKTFAECFDKCAAKGIAIEFNTHCLRGYSAATLENSEFMRMFRIALRCGCQMTFGSDSHDPTHLDFWEKAYMAACMLELTPEQLRVL